MNERKTRKLLSAALAGILCLSIPAAALAADFAAVKGGDIYAELVSAAKKAGII